MAAPKKVLRVTPLATDRGAAKPVQDWNPSKYAANARFVADLGDKVLDLLDAKVGEKVLDLGCGDGVLTARISAAGAKVLGVDSSSKMVEAAVARGVTAVVADGEALGFVQEFDAVFSNAALHWMKDPDAVMQGVRRALKAGGRFVAEFGGVGNTRTVIDAIDRELTDRGYPGLVIPGIFLTLRNIKNGCECLVFESVVWSWLTALRGFRLVLLIGWIFSQLPFWGCCRNQRLAARDAIVEALRPKIQDEDGVWWVDYVRIRFAAVLAV